MIIQGVFPTQLSQVVFLNGNKKNIIKNIIKIKLNNFRRFIFLIVMLHFFMEPDILS